MEDTVNLIITSEQRVGSRWMHYLFAELYKMGPSPEIDRKRIIYDVGKVRQFFKQNRIVKFHGPHPTEILKAIQPIDYKILGVVRNPRDRAVSQAFHNRYHPKHDFNQKQFETDAEAVEWTMLSDPGFLAGSKRQWELMMQGYSTRNYEGGELPYIWTSYEWLLEDTVEEVTTIAEFFGEVPENIGHVINNNSFARKTGGRQPGVEKRRDTWRRKGVNNDWANWFSDDLEDQTEGDYHWYFLWLDECS